MKIKKYLVLTALGLTLGLNSCGAPEQIEEPSIFVEEGNFSDITDFDEVIDHRTDEQIALMEYTGSYRDMTTDEVGELSGNVGGTKNVSPKGIKVNWEHEPNGELVRYQLEVSKNSDFSDSYTFNGTKAKTITIQNLEINTEYFYRVIAEYDDDTFDMSTAHTLETADVTPRNINIDGITNCRDLGGKVTLSGARIRQGMIYRTGALDDANQSGCKVTDAGKETIIKQLGMRSEIDIRGGENGTQYEGSGPQTHESQLNDKSIKFFEIPFAYAGGKDNLFRNVIPFRKFFECFANPEECYPTFFHCRIGTDRTGMCAAVLNGLLGLDFDQIYQDYLFSNFGKIGKNCAVNQNNRDNVASYLDVVATYPGDTFQEQCYNFLLTMGVRASTLNSILENMLEGEQPTFMDDAAAKIKVIGSDDLAIEGGSTKKTSTAFRSPAKYISLKGKGQKVTYTFSSTEALTAGVTSMIMSHNTTSTLNSALKLTIDNTAASVLNTSFATTDLGFASSGDYWEPAILNEGVSLGQAGTHTITIESQISDEIQLTDLVLTLNKASTLTKVA